MNTSMRVLRSLAWGASCVLASTAHASLAISEVPLFLRAGTTPNVVLTIDDSGSMASGYVPDSVGDSSTKRNSRLFTAPSANALYYNPRVQYDIPVRGDGVTYTTSFTQAFVNGFDTSKGSTNLSSNGYKPIYNCAPDTSFSSCSRANGAGGGASTTTINYTRTCSVEFDDRSRNRDTLIIRNCSPSLPTSGAGSLAEADESQITIARFSNTYNKTYSYSSISRSGSTYTLSIGNQISDDADERDNVTVSWTETSTTTVTEGPAYYHLYYTDKPGAAKPSGCNDTVTDTDCYVYVRVGSADDIAAGNTAAQQQNFANWFSFYRTRALATMTAAMNVVYNLGNNQIRLGWQGLNSKCNSFGTSCQSYTGSTHENRIRTLDALKTGSTTKTHRSDFYDWISRLDVDGFTPLRAAMRRAGELYKTTGKDSPYAEEPYVNRGTELSCRRNFHLLMTDGLWNQDEDTNFGGNVDGTSKTLPDGTAYTPRAPYRDSASSAPSGLSYADTLADIAFNYWSSDLVSSLANNLEPYVADRSGTASNQYWNARNNPATWQHMVNYTVSLGLGGVLQDPEWGGSTFAGDYPNLVNGTVSWPAVDEGETTDENKVYDLWHAAINSRGEFFNADSPDALNTAFQSVFASILTKNPSSAALTANSTSFGQGALVYQAKYDSSDWHGQLTAISVQSSGGLGSVQWDAARLIPAHGSRKITSWNGSQGFNFNSCTVATSGMSSAQAAALNRNAAGSTDSKCTDRVNWLRGQAISGMRARPVSVLGDIINSDPVYVKDQNYGYSNAGFAESASYTSFVSAKASRIPMVYVGANDGMLHGFRADVGHPDSGKELMAHIPAGVYGKLSRLTDPSYAHTYYVDGGPTAADVYVNGQWRTVLVGGLGAGGKSIYALDVSDPANHGPGKAMWEFADANSLGLTFAQPQIGRLYDGSWATIFGNGYNSTTGEASLFIVNTANGQLLKKITVDSTGDNGLSSPVLFDTNGDKIVDVVYAGDLKGNLWKFDLAANTAAQWVAGNGGLPLLVARNASGQVQPITSKPAVTKPTTQPQGGVMVFFGTGSYMTETDPADTKVQSFYGIWDNNATKTLGRTDLQVQTIEYEGSEFGLGVRQTSANGIDWTIKRGWYMDLVSPIVVSGTPAERVVSTPLVRYDRVIFVTTLPNNDACVPGGTSWLIEVDFATGARTTLSVFDFTADGLFNDADLLANRKTASGVRSTEGMLRTPAWLEGARSSELAVKQMSGSTGGIFVVNNRKPIQPGSIRRLYWQQLR